MRGTVGGDVEPGEQPFGSAGRNSVTGPNYAMTSVSLVKNTHMGALGAAGGLQIRLEVFNVLNRPNFATPDRVVFAAQSANEAPLATAGRIATSTHPRSSCPHRGRSATPGATV